MKTAVQVQWSYKETEKVNFLGDTVASDLTYYDEQTKYLNRRQSYVVGNSEYYKVNAATGVTIQLVGRDWLTYDWTTAYVLVCAGASRGCICTITNQDVTAETLTLSVDLNLSESNLLRLEKVTGVL